MATPGAPSPDRLSDAPPCPPGPQGPRGERGGARLAEPRIKAGRCRCLPGRGERRGEMAVLPRLLRLLLLLLAASSAALLATSAHSSCPGPLAHTMHSTFMFAATSAPLGGLASPRTRTRRLAHPLPRTELARLLALVFPSRSGRSGAGNRSAGDPQASGAAHRLRTGQRSAPKRAWPPAQR